MSLTVLKAPQPDHNRDSFRIFLAGSIDMGAAIDWQRAVEDSLADVERDVTIFNPRRDDWDSTWVQDISHPGFKEQVDWELDHLEKSDLIVVYFDAKGPAPITLLELGMFAGRVPMIVCCPAGYWRRGNVQIVCSRANVPIVESLDDLIKAMSDALG